MLHKKIRVLTPKRLGIICILFSISSSISMFFVMDKFWKFLSMSLIWGMISYFIYLNYKKHFDKYCKK